MNAISRWGAAQLKAFRPTVRIAPSEWAEQFRRLSRTQSARPGRWKNANAPYLVGLMDLCVRREVHEVTIVKAGQVGVSEAMRNLLGYYAHQEPDPVLLVLPDENVGRRIVGQRILPLLRETPCLRELLTSVSRDVQLRSIILANGFTLRLGWSGSPATLASDPCRVVINDEVDKFQAWTGRESDPISLGHIRTQTYGDRRLVVNVSTPTTSYGLISQRYESCPIKIHYAVPCPHCGERQRLVFARLKWETALHGTAAAEDVLSRPESAWYECSGCKQPIHEADRVGMVRAGAWVCADGTPIETIPRLASSRVGVHVWAAYALWIPFREIAAEFLRSKGDMARMQNFANSWLGEPFHQQIARPTYGTIASKYEVKREPRRVPDWAVVLLATADTQKDHFYYVVRAWGAGFRSRRVDHGIATTFEDLRARIFGVSYANETEGAAEQQVRLLGIDSGGGAADGVTRTHEVYRFALSDPHRIRAMKGSGVSRETPIVTRRISYRPPNQQNAPFPVFLTLVDANHFKDRLAAAMGGKVGDVDQWEISGPPDPDYDRQMAAEHKVLVRKPGGRQAEVWQPVTTAAPNHYWDCEYMQFALADMARVDLARVRVARPAGVAPRPEPRSPPPSSGRGQIRRAY